MSDDLRDLDELLAIAHAATEGPWVKDPDQPDIVMKPDDYPSTWDGKAICTIQHDDFGLFEEADANFIATFNPRTVMQLLRLIDELQERTEADDE